MAVTSDDFPTRKRPPSAGAFAAPNLFDRGLLRSLLLLSQDISSLQPSRLLLHHRCSVSLIRKTRLLTVLLEEVSRSSTTCFSTSAALCFDELHILLRRINALIEDCAKGSRTWRLLQTESIANSFHELTMDLSILLDILPVEDLEVGVDVEELLALLKRQCSETKTCADAVDSNLRIDLLDMLDKIKREIVPDQTKLSEIFDRLQIRDSPSCGDEIEALEDEVQNQLEDRSKADVIALIGLVRYAKCVLFGISTPRSGRRRRKSASDVNIPADFRCPISLDLMRDPVVVATGQTYDRASITAWIESGHNTCPKTAQVLSHTDLLTNSALRNLIRIWCREQRIQFDIPQANDRNNGVSQNKTALEATKMTVLFLIDKLTASESSDSANRLVHELRVLAKADSDCRQYVGDAGGLPVLVRFLGSDHPSLQVNAITTILNLSILDANKSRIMETEGVLNGVLEVLRSGATWESKGNAAATIFSLTGNHSNRRRLGRKTRVVKGLLDLAKLGTGSCKRDALMAILSLAGDREAAGKLIEGGIVQMAEEMMDSGLREEAVTILEVVVKRGGAPAVAAVFPLINKLAKLMSEGSDRTRESAVATLVNLCRKGGAEVVVELAAVTGIERVIWELMGTGTGRPRRKAAALLRILRRWAVRLDADSAEAWRFLVLA